MKEIGKGERVALAKLAVEHLERSQRPLRIAIDAAIWNFQNQAGQGGKNPALRTLFYRLLKLLALPIHPVFVYDGKNKPLTKRGKTVARYGSCISNEMSKKLIQAFRFPYHMAPGEAEAECAMLQKQGLVDAVMSEDVDAIMFGSTLTLRDWSKEATKHSKSPTHVSVLDAPRIKSISGLDPEGMILVALLSGGDYDEAGVTGFGLALACEIARAGFASDLLDLVRQDDEDGLREWRERLQFELETNESGYFKRKHKSVRVPDSFPNRRVLSYYMSPAVSPKTELPRLERKWAQSWEDKIDVQALRNYAAETFDWSYKPGAWKFVRVTAPALLADGLRRGDTRGHIRSIEQITEQRKHFVSDGIPELRVTVVPADVVGLDLDAEEDSPEYLETLAAEETHDVAETCEADGESLPPNPSEKRKTPPWSPYETEKMWIAETIVSLGAWEHVQRWRQIQKEIETDPKKFATRKCRSQNKARKQEPTGAIGAGALMSYVIRSKPGGEGALSGGTRAPSSPRLKGRIGAGQLSSASAKRTANSSTTSGSCSLHDFFKPTKNRLVLETNHSKAVVAEDSPLDRKDFFTIEDGRSTEVGLATFGESSSSPTASSSWGNAGSAVKKSIMTKQGQIPTTRQALTTKSPFLTTAKSSLEKVTTVNCARGQLPEESILILSSPIHKMAELTKTNDIETDGVEVFTETENVLSSVTQRKRRAKKDRRAELPSPVSSPICTRRPIENLMPPLVDEQNSGSAGGATSRRTTDPAVISPGINPSLSTKILSACQTHVHAIPRSSLPGTWKEVECESNPNSECSAQGPIRAPRVSIIDLTSG